MNTDKIGKLILRFRLEKGLTQQELADQLLISNKTISKWENGGGCPDLTLWNELSTILGIDIRKMMEGAIIENQKDIGKLRNIQFYVCPICGNIITSTSSSSISCCSRNLMPLQLQPQDIDHVIEVDISDHELYIRLHHDMSKEHHISFAASVRDDNIIFQRLYPEQDAALHLPYMNRNNILYVYCINHGLYAYQLDDYIK